MGIISKNQGTFLAVKMRLFSQKSLIFRFEWDKSGNPCRAVFRKHPSLGPSCLTRFRLQFTFPSAILPAEWIGQTSRLINCTHKEKIYG